MSLELYVWNMIQVLDQEPCLPRIFMLWAQSAASFVSAPQSYKIKIFSVQVTCMAVFQDGITEKFNLQLNLPVAQSSFNLGLSSWVELKVNIQEVSIAALTIFNAYIIAGAYTLVSLADFISLLTKHAKQAL